MLDKAALTFCGALALALVHVLAGRLRFLDVVPRSRWLSLAGGVAVAYALVHLLPELEERRRTIAEAGDSRFLEHLLYLIVLAGLVSFYGMEKLAQRRRPGTNREAPKSVDESPEIEEKTPDAVFWLHVGSFALYNALVGYALVKEDRDFRTLALYVVAIGFHFLVNDHGLRKRHQRQYAMFGRWALSGAVLAGWAVGSSLHVWPVVTAGILGFLAGGILLNTFKEELPEEQVSRFWVFAAGAAVYSAVLLVE